VALNGGYRHGAGKPLQGFAGGIVTRNLHLQRNGSNNKKNNLEIVCGHCHTKRHLKMIDGEWVFDNKYLTPRKLIYTF